MSLIQSISIQNFKCYRKPQSFDVSQGNFFIGPNNAGKSAVLKALHCFFDDNQFVPEYINKTELRSRLAGYNKSIVSITFDFDVITTKGLKSSQKKEFGNTLILSKNFTLREVTNTIAIDYTYNGATKATEELHPEIQKLLSKIFISYIHPQEAKELLKTAQDKLKTRLLANWGRSPTLKDSLNKLQDEWTELRKLANSYLSSGLTSSLQNIWPGCETKVDLPESIEEIIGVSEIIFKGSSDLPDVSLTSQGTGAQSTILYQTHFLLDSDKTLHRGFHYPIWLIEEPESFLHADIIFKLGYLLCSDIWLNNIQMFVSTHSPLLLATSKQNGDKIRWSSLDRHNVSKNKIVKDWTDEEIKEIGVLMGDPNFDIYFRTSKDKKVVMIEDTKVITGRKLVEGGILVTQQLNGVTELKRYFDVFRSIDISMGRNVYLLIDNDDGFKEFNKDINYGREVARTPSGFIKYAYNNNTFLIVFPDKFAMEELFDEHDLILESCANKIFNSAYTHALTGGSIPTELSRVHAAIRSKTSSGLEEAKQLIRGHQDVKDIFWDEVEKKNFAINTTLAAELQDLIV